MGVHLAGEDRLPPGRHRELVLLVRELYFEAGEPPVAGLSYSAGDGGDRRGDLTSARARGILSGEGALPPRGPLLTLVRLLREEVAQTDADRDVHELVQRIKDAWVAARTAQDRQPVTAPRRGTTTGSRRPSEPSSEASDPAVRLFKETRRRIGSEAATLLSTAIAEHGVDGEGIPLLTAEHWVPPRPLALEQVGLRFAAPPSADYTDARARTRHYWPGQEAGYSTAVTLYDRPGTWFDGRSFRLTGVDARPDAVDLDFASGTYFEAFDTCEPLGYEAALRYAETGGASVYGDYRTWLADPFDLANRCGVPGVNVLTVRRARKDVTFYLHQRLGVATAMGTVHVVPAGEFQPSWPSDEPSWAELDLLSTIVREYAEEFLGAEDMLSQEHHDEQVDFGRHPKYAKLDEALRGGGAEVHYLGLGLYPLTWKPEILVVCVFDGPLFDRLFRDMVDEMLEGRLLRTDRLSGFRYALPGRRGPYQGLRFNEETVAEHADSPTTLPAGRACLKLAWKHRELLGIDR